MVPETCPYTALSRTFRALSHPSRIGTWDCDQVFVCNFVTKIYRRIVFKTFFWTFDFWTVVLHPFFEVATLQKELARFGPGLGPGGFTFREPFADLSRTFRGFLV